MHRKLSFHVYLAGSAPSMICTQWEFGTAPLMLKRIPGSALLFLQQKKLSFQVCWAGLASSQILSQWYPAGTPALLHLKSSGQDGRELYT